MLKLFLCFLCGWCGLFSAVAQEDRFFITSDADRVELDFITRGNQIIIPVMVNGVELNFALDSGATKSIIFDFSGIDSLNLVKGRLLRYEGYGEQQYFEAYHSENNTFSIENEFVNSNVELLIMMDESFSISQRLGYPVNGLIGKSFFDNHIVHIDNEYLKIIIYKHDAKLPRRIRGLKPYPLEFINGKPHITSLINNENTYLGVTTILDTGSSDALLISNIDSLQFKMPTKGFEDYLGYGMNGKIFGKRSKLDQLQLWNQNIDRVTVSIPYPEYLIKKKRYINNYASIGMELMRRFNITFDYKNRLVYVRPLKSLADGFFYNMTGISVKESGFEVEAGLIHRVNEKAQGLYKGHDGQVTIKLNKKLKYIKIPKLIIETIAKGSVSDRAGILIGDRIIQANRYEKSELSLQLLSDLFHTKPYSTLKLTILRDGVKIKKELKLVPLIE